MEGIDLENLPEGWRVGTLSDIANIIMGQSPEGESYNEAAEGVALINGPVEFGEYFTVKTKWTTEPKKYCEKGDLIFCVRGSTVGKNVIADDRYAIGRGVCAIRSKYQNYLIQLMKCNLNELLKDVTGSTFPNIDRVTISDYPITISTNTLLEEFEKKVSAISNLVWIKSLENQKLSELKNLLLSKLATVQ
ncbi:MAG: restriction endonuclease subunit S [Sphingobacteriales bacterium]|nr:restriction endonuclease subunit S [Sphingobacteriales bacterium]